MSQLVLANVMNGESWKKYSGYTWVHNSTAYISLHEQIVKIFVILDLLLFKKKVCEVRLTVKDDDQAFP